MANLAIFSSLPQRGDTVIYDELSHACIKDGIRLSMANKLSFKHNDMSHLEQKLKKATGSIYIAVESIYSMDGDACKLQEITDLAQMYNAKIIIDEAHGTGVMGKNGGGLCSATNLSSNIFARIYTFGKAMGIHGAIIVGSNTLKEYLVNFARPFIYSTAPSPYSVIAMREAFNYLNTHPELANKLNERILLFKDLFCQKLKAKNSLIQSDHPIQSILVPGNEQAKRLSVKLEKDGLDARPILSPTVKEGTERLRICLHTFNSANDISRLIDSLEAL